MTEDDASSGQLTFAHRLFYRALLQKRPIILRNRDVPSSFTHSFILWKYVSYLRKTRSYVVATISKLLEIIGLFCKRAL